MNDLGMINPQKNYIASVPFFVLLIAGYSGSQTVRCTTWNLQWCPNGSANEAFAA